MEEPQILIVELGSQHTLQIQRRLRDLGHLSIILKPAAAETYLATNHVRCVIGSGGMKSVNDNDATKLPRGIFAHRQGSSAVPYLGICYGMQAMAHELGGKVERKMPEYADATILLKESILFNGLSAKEPAWMSHGDSVVELPNGFKVIAHSDTETIAGISHANGMWYGVQFHPEVAHTPSGSKMLRNFVEDVAHCTPNYTRQSLPILIEQRILQAVGDRKAIILFSGGVDSTTLAAIASKALGNRLLAITIDAGHMREGEVEQIKANAWLAGVRLKVVDAADAFIADIGKTLDPEEKRAAFRYHYGAVARREALEFGATVLLQGTIAPDRIESGMTGGAVIKTHHNSKGVDFGDLIEVHPIDELFKDEVRQLSKSIGLPSHIFNRPPFPGPGNFLRHPNIYCTREVLNIVQWAEARASEYFQKDIRYRDVSQLVVAAVGRAVGVKGDGPVFGYIIGVRAVRTSDFMTAEGVTFAEDFQKALSKLLTQHPLIVHVGFFPTDKPPATTEFE